MRLLAISSGGGHWIELIRLAPLFERYETSFATVNSSYKKDVGGKPFYLVRDATSWTPIALMVVAYQVFSLLLRARPDVVITTGAAPGLLALVAGRILGARTIWLDSIANVDQLSRSGVMARRFADLHLTQWEHLAQPDGPLFAGKVL